MRNLANALVVAGVLLILAGCISVIYYRLAGSAAVHSYVAGEQPGGDSVGRDGMYDGDAAEASVPETAASHGVLYLVIVCCICYAAVCFFVGCVTSRKEAHFLRRLCFCASVLGSCIVITLKALKEAIDCDID